MSVLVVDGAGGALRLSALRQVEAARLLTFARRVVLIVVLVELYGLVVVATAG
jgi:hypothetical protein